MSIAADVSAPQNDQVVVAVASPRAASHRLAIVLVGISLLATLAWSGALIWLLSSLIKSL
jgi:hypothetical protein